MLIAVEFFFWELNGAEFFYREIGCDDIYRRRGEDRCVMGLSRWAVFLLLRGGILARKVSFRMYTVQRVDV